MSTVPPPAPTATPSTANRAHRYRQRHEIVAAQRADEMLDRGDRNGELVWLRIRRAIAELQAIPSGPAH
jgi:hypothetical protein